MNACAFGPATAAATCAEPEIDSGKLRAPRLLLLEPEPLIESLTWLDPATEPLPDADERVLILIEDADGARDWDSGFYDRDDGAWRLCESGGKVDGAVVLFARPSGPKV